MNQTTNREGIELIKSFEGFRGVAYKAVPQEPYYTIGFGHYGKDVKKGATMTKTQAELTLRDDLKAYESKVSIFDDKYHWTSNEFSALVSFAYNVGSINQLTQNGTRTKAQITDAMLYYIKDVTGKPLDGLLRRRKAERALFLKPDTNAVNLAYSESTTIKEIVDDVLKGKFGNDEIRKDKLYRLIQGFVNARFR